MAFRAGLMFQTFVVGQLARALLGEAIAEGGLTTEEYGVLSGIGVIGQITPTELAAMTGMPPATLSRHLRRLTDRGQIKRVRHPRDGRSYRIELTARGRRTFQQNGEALVRTIRRIEGHLTIESAEVIAAMREFELALRAALDENARAADENARSGRTGRRRPPARSR